MTPARRQELRALATIECIGNVLVRRDDACAFVVECLDALDEAERREHLTRDAMYSACQRVVDAEVERDAIREALENAGAPAYEDDARCTEIPDAERVRRLGAEAGRLREALRWYADPNQYGRHGDIDDGRRARAALGETGGGDGLG